jgi:hypothetical protein
MAPKLIINDGRLVVYGGRLITSCNATFPPVPTGQMRIVYSWPPPSRDLDTCTVFLGGRAGYASGPSSEWIIWDSGDNTGPGPETVWIRLDDAHAADAWTDQVFIQCWAGWYTPAGGSGGCTLTITYNGQTQRLSIPSVGTQLHSAEGTTLCATIRVLSSGTFTVL